MSEYFVYLLYHPNGKFEIYHCKQEIVESDIPDRQRNKKIEVRPGMWEYGIKRKYKIVQKKVFRQGQK